MLQQAAQLEESLGPEGMAENPAGTYLNMAAVLSAQGDHPQALSYASQACGLFLQRYGLSTPDVERYALGTGTTASGLPVPGSLGGSVTDAVTTMTARLLHALPAAQGSLLAMCYYNCAVEFEHMEQFVKAKQHYRLAAGLATRLYGRGSHLAMMFNKTYEVS